MVLCLECALSRKDNNPPTLQNTITDTVQNCVKKMNEAYERKSKFCTRDMNKIKSHVIECLTECANLVGELKEMLAEGNTNLGDQNKRFADKMELILLTGEVWTRFASCNVTLLSEIGSMDPVKKNSLKLEYIKEDIHSIENLLDLNLLHGVIQGTILVSKEETEIIMSWNNGQEIIPRNYQLDNSEERLLDKDCLYKKLSTGHPHCSNLILSEQLTKEKVNTLAKGFTYRPAEPTFINLSKVMYNFF